MVPSSSRHQQLNLYPSSDRNTQLSSPRHTQSPGIINKWFLSFCSSVFTRAHATQTGFSLYHCRRRWLFGLLVSVSPGLELHVCAPCQVDATLQLKPRVSYTLRECSAHRDPCPALGSHFLKLSTLGERGLDYPLLLQLIRTKTPPWFHSFTHAHTDSLYLTTLFLSDRVCLLRSRKVSRHFIHK